VGQSIQPGDLLFQAHTKTGVQLDPAPYRATLTLRPAPSTPAPWLLGTLGA
jgi:hypothetical protein